MNLLEKLFTEFCGVVSQVVGYLGTNPTVLICIIEGLFLAIGGVWCFFIKGRKEGKKIDLENEKAKLELEKIKTLNALEVAKAKNELEATSTPEYQKALAKLVLDDKKAEIAAKKADTAAKKAETAKVKKETEKVVAEIDKIKAETENIRNGGNENNQDSAN